MEQYQAQVLARLKEFYKEVGTALRFSNPLELLIATMLSAQATDKQVNKVTLDLFKKYTSAKDFAVVSAEELGEDIKSIGLYKNKSKNIVATCKILVEQYDGEVPCDREKLESLPGVGRKTANVVLSNGFHVPALAVDTHVFRVSHRLGLAKGKDVLKTEQELMALIPEEDWSKAHHWLIWHGRLFCKARNPLCERCMLEDICISRKEFM